MGSERGLAMDVLTSRQNPLCAHLRKLTAQRSYRRKSGEYLADGEKLWQEAVKWHAPVKQLITTPEVEVALPDGVKHIRVSPELMAYLSPMESPQGFLFTLELPRAEAPTLDGKRYIALDGLQDPGNVGTIWRTADALGADGVILLNHCADPYNHKTVRAAMGASFRLPAWEMELEELIPLLRARDLPLYATALREDSLPMGQVDLSQGVVVIGNEGHGVSDDVLERCDSTFIIPMRARCESLNAAAAATVVLWEMARRDASFAEGGG